MSLKLERPGTTPGVEVLTMHDLPRKVYVTAPAAGFDLSLHDVLFLCSYVLTNTDLDPDDERLKFVEAVKAMKVVDGWNKGGKRLEHPATHTYFYRRPDEKGGGP